MSICWYPVQCSICELLYKHMAFYLPNKSTRNKSRIFKLKWKRADECRRIKKSEFRKNEALWISTTPVSSSSTAAAGAAAAATAALERPVSKTSRFSATSSFLRDTRFHTNRTCIPHIQHQNFAPAPPAEDLSFEFSLTTVINKKMFAFVDVVVLFKNLFRELLFAVNERDMRITPVHAREQAMTMWKKCFYFIFQIYFPWITEKSPFNCIYIRIFVFYFLEIFS